jgi:dihydropteroate synthase
VTVMGVVNVTPDSFSDGGRWLDHEAAVAHGLDLIAEGAAVIDVGGESTRPGASPVPDEEERRRVLPVIEALAPHARISVDTRKEGVARDAVAAGATLVNDVSASLWPVAADLGVGWVCMHMRGEPRTMQDDPVYDDVVDEVCAFLADRAATAVLAGVPEVWIDPGFGFGKTATHNLRLLAHIDRVVALGHPVAVGLSRKATVGRLVALSDAGGFDPVVVASGAVDGPVRPVPTDDRLQAGIALQVWAMAHGAAMLRAHDVRAAVQAAKVVAP